MMTNESEPLDEYRRKLAELGDDSSDAQAAFPYTDLGNARRLVDSYGADLRYVPEWSVWLYWDAHRWAEDITGDVERKAKAVVDAFLTELSVISDRDERKRLLTHWARSQSSGRLAAMVSVASTEAAVPVLVSQLDADAWLFNCASGVINLRSGSMHAPTTAKRELVTKLTAAKFDSSAVCPKWETFVDWALGGDVELIEFVQRCVGYSLTGLTVEQSMFILHGGGANGKSTFVAVLLALLGSYGTAAEPDLLMASTHERHPAGVADLVGRRFVSATETEEGRRLSEVLVKQLVGGDMIKTRRMRENFFEFTPRFKLWMSTNHKPRIVGTDTAIWRRIHLIPFTATVADADKNLHLTSELLAELDGILQWALRGLADWRDNGGLRPCAAVIEASKQYRADEDHVGRFIADCCLFGDDASISAREMRLIYEAWCAESGERNPWSSKRLAEGFIARGAVNALTTGKPRTRIWLGITSALNPMHEFSYGRATAAFMGERNATNVTSEQTQKSVLNPLPAQTRNTNATNGTTGSPTRTHEILQTTVSAVRGVPGENRAVDNPLDDDSKLFNDEF